MTDPIKILHIDRDYNVTYFVSLIGASIKSPISLEQAVDLLKTERFDLILSEPHNRAILVPQEGPGNMDCPVYQD
jgi:hypothetical protein